MSGLPPPGGYPFPGFRPGMPPPGMPPPGMPPPMPMGGPLGMGRPPMMMPPGGMGMPGGMGFGQGFRPPMPQLPPRPTGMTNAGVYVPAAIAEKSTTVYVGKIAASVPDDVVRDLLDACGKVKSWKRQVDPDTKQPKGFGFCEFEDAEGVLRAMRLLNALKLDGQELLLKCNAATQKYTEQYEQRKTAEKAAKKARAAEAAKEEGAKSEGEAAAEGADKQGEDGEAEQDEDTVADNRVLELIMSVVSERGDKHSSALPPPPPLPGGGRDTGGAAQAASNFLAQLGSSSRGDKDRDKERERDREKESRERDRDREREADAERRREEEKRREAEAKYESKLREWERYERERQSLREREGARRYQAEQDWRASVRTDLDAYESDDDREPWERRPLRGSRKSNERRKRRLAEDEEDEIDRQREAREMERRAKRAAANGEASHQHEGTPGPAGSTVYDNAQLPSPPNGNAHAQLPTPHAHHDQPPVKHEPDVDTNDPIYQAMLAAARAPPPTQHGSQGGHAGAGRHPGERVKSESPPPPAAGPAASGSTGPAPAGGGRLSFGAGARNRNTAALAAMFGDEEETTQRRQLKPIRYTEEELRGVHEAEEGGGQAAGGAGGASAASPAVDPKVALKAMMDRIPTSRDGVWGYPIKWSHYNGGTMSEKFKAWVSSKVEQLLGVKEPTLVDYVVKLLGQHTGPEALFGELAPVLDNDTETFVIKLYRMVIFETEKAALGLSA